MESELELSGFSVSSELVASSSSVVTKVLGVDTSVVTVIVVHRVVKGRQAPAKSLPSTLGKSRQCSPIHGLSCASFKALNSWAETEGQQITMNVAKKDIKICVSIVDERKFAEI